jgi:hypothetical protein
MGAISLLSSATDATVDFREGPNRRFGRAEKMPILKWGHVACQDDWIADETKSA